VYLDAVSGMVPEQGFGKNAARGVAGAQKEHAFAFVGHGVSSDVRHYPHIYRGGAVVARA
jgi:hypothetical protein